MRYPSKQIKQKSKQHDFFNSVVLIFLFVASNSFANCQESDRVELIRNKVADAPWEQQRLKNEIINMRDERSKHFELSEGNRIAFFASGLIHYKDNYGNWLDIINTIVVNSDSSHELYPFKNETGIFKTYFPKNPFMHSIKSKYEETIIHEKVKSIKFIDSEGSSISTLCLNFSEIELFIDENTIRYTNFFPHLSLSYSLENSSKKFNLEVLSPSFLDFIPLNAVSLIIEEEITIENSQCKEIKFSESEIGLSLIVKGKNIADFLNPKSFDCNESAEFSMSHSSLSWTKLDSNKILFKNTFDCNWITSSEREFPLFLDPVVNYLPTLTTNWTGRQGTSNGKTSGYLRITGNTTSSWAKYNISTIPNNAIINSVIYFGSHYTGSGNTTAKYCRLRHMESDPLPASAATIWNACNGGTIVSPNFIWAQGSSYQWRSITLNASGTSTLQNSISQGWYALGTQWVSGGTSFAYHYGVDGTTAQITYIQVDYTSCSTGIVNSAQTICSGNQPNPLTVSGSLGSIQWQTSTNGSTWTNISGATSTTLSAAQMGALTSNRFYRVINTGSCTTAASSNSVLITINSVSAGSIGSNQTICAGTTPYALTSLSTATGSGSITYQWQSSSNGSTWTNISGATSAFYSPPALLTTMHYRRQANSILNGNSCLAFSNTVIITVNTISSGSIGSNQTVCSGASISFASSLPANASGILSYQWQSSLNGTTWNNISGATSATYSQASIDSTTYFRRVASSTMDGLQCSANSNQILVVVVQQPSVTIQNSTVGFICEGSSFILTSEVSNVLSYQWRLNNSNIDGATNPIYTGLLGGNYTLIVSSSGCTVVSNNLLIQLTPLPLVNAGEDQFICLGDFVALNGSGASNYLWNNGVTNGVPFLPDSTALYTVSGTSDVTGCIGSDEVQVTVNLPSFSTVNVSSIGSFHMNGQVFNESGTFSQTIINQFNCDSVITLNLTIHGLNTPENENQEITIFPNPSTSGVFHISLPVDLHCEKLKIYNTAGILVDEIIPIESNIDISPLSAGYYFLHLDCANFRRVLKLQKL
jgi:hypothetical protein